MAYLTNRRSTVPIASVLPTRWGRIRRGIKWFLGTSLLVVIGVFGWLGWRANIALSQISAAPADEKGSILTFLTKHQDAQLKGEAEDRINILLLGMGGSGHPGGSLTDTIMVFSLAPKEGRGALLSIPRDLYVPIAGDGAGKLNSAHATGEQMHIGSGPTVAQETVEAVLGIPIHYFIRIDFKGFIQLVDALGGVDVTVEKAINDPFFPDERLEGYEPFYLQAGPTHMDGDLALKFARSRETTSDFDRARRQQQLLKAIKDTLLSAGVLTNPSRLVDLLDIAGNHIRTDLSSAEMERFLQIGKNLDLSALTTKVLDTASSGPLESRTEDGVGYIIVPRAGRNNFSAVQMIAKNLLQPSVLESATISIQNASGRSELGGNVALLLRGYGYQVAEVTTQTPTASQSQVLVARSDLFPQTAAFLAERFGVAPTVTTRSLHSDFLLILGSDYARATSAAEAE
ncbi:LCP family protein [Candidatus Berkelbacteria bacterium]|nr:LCP family protein [Candidatus Berkelbacteria bacterium]